MLKWAFRKNYYVRLCSTIEEYTKRANRKAQQMMEETVSVRLPEAQKEELATVAKTEQRSIGQIIRMAVESYLKHWKAQMDEQSGE
jgi:predicted HicB family RNase H-like nuclease